MKTAQYLDAARKKLGVESDYALAPHLGMTRFGVSKLRRGVSVMSNTTAARLAEILKLHPLEVIADAELERGTNDELWKRIAKKVAMVLFAAGAASSGGFNNNLFASPSPSTAEERQVPEPNTHCASRRKRLAGWCTWWLLLLASSLAAAGQPVYGLKVFDSLPQMCQVNANGIGDTRQWTPAQAGITQPIYIKRAAVWVGAAYGFRGDIAHGLSAGDNVLSSEGWDHYAEPTGSAGQVREISWGGDYVKLEPFDVLTFGWACSGFGHGGPIEWIVTIWYTLAP